MTFAKAEYQSIFGKVESGWHIEEEKIVYQIVIPSGCTARICIPGRPEEMVYAGKYKQIMKYLYKFSLYVDFFRNMYNNVIRVKRELIV